MDPVATARAHRFRWEIQGLRALAVLLVVGDHLRGWPSGGYVGVDVFFVVSGYVITGLLLREAELTGRISLIGFYRRRIKRIMPAAVVVLLTTIAAGALVLSFAARQRLDVDALWAALFAANWRFVLIGTDYMHAGDAVSPLQHYWSLSVEEQFYFVWPLVIIAVLLITRRSPRTRRIVTIVAAGAIVLVSGAWALHQSVSSPTTAYFSTLTRAWELGLGVLVACSAPITRRLPERFQTPLAWCGLATVIASALLLNADSRFPAPGAFLPTLGSAAILVAGERGPVVDLYPLTNRAARYVGDISYSLYLWHFPVLVFVGALQPERQKRYLVLSVVLMAALSVLSYHFIENPLRRRRWRWWRRSTPVPRVRSRWAVSAAVGLVIVVVATAFGAVRLREPVSLSPVDISAIQVASITTGALAERERLVSSALAARTWPDLQPAVMNPGVVAVAPEWVHDGCLGAEVHAEPDPFQNALRCVYGDPAAKRTLALLGDSHAISYLPGIRKALGKEWRIEVYTMEECPAVWVRVNRSDGSPHPDCDAFRTQVERHLKAEHPDLVFMTSSSVSMTTLASGATGDAARVEWQAGTRAAVKALARDTRTLLFVDDPPPEANLGTCNTPLTGPRDCVATVNGYYLQMVEAQQAAVRAVGARNVSYPSSLPWFCSAQGLCPAFVGSTPVTVDGFHLTAAGARALAPLLREAVESPRVARLAPVRQPA